MPRGVDPKRKPFKIISARELERGELPPNSDHPLAKLPPAARVAAFEEAYVRRVRVQAEQRLSLIGSEKDAAAISASKLEGEDHEESEQAKD